MIIIKSISYIETPRDTEEVCLREPPETKIPVYTERGAELCEVREIRTLIRGRRFVRPSDGQDIVIGCYPDVERLLGMQYDAWENMEYDLRAANKQANSIHFLYNNLKKATLWSRIKWVFTGVK